MCFGFNLSLSSRTDSAASAAAGAGEDKAGIDRERERGSEGRQTRRILEFHPRQGATFKVALFLRCIQCPLVEITLDASKMNENFEGKLRGLN